MRFRLVGRATSQKGIAVNGLGLGDRLPRLPGALIEFRLSSQFPDRGQVGPTRKTMPLGLKTSPGAPTVEGHGGGLVRSPLNRHLVEGCDGPAGRRPSPGMAGLPVNLPVLVRTGGEER